PQWLERIERITDAPVTRDGGELLLVRRLYASGRSSVTLNGNPITLGMLKQVGETLVDVHGQHDHQYLLKPSNQLDVLDQFGGLGELREKYHEVYLKVLEAKRRIGELSADRALRRQQLELYRFQADEIDAAQLDAAEFAELGARASVLANLEKLKKDAGATHSALYEADGSVLERLKMMGAVLAELALLDANLKGVADALRDSSIQLEEVAFDLSRYLDKLDLDPAELLEVNDRLNVINRLLSKYGDPLEATLAYRQEIGQKIAQLEQTTDEFSALQAELTPLLAELKDRGAELSVKRRAVAKKFSPLVESQLSELGMEKAKFRIDFSAVPGAIAGEDVAASPSGFDQVEFIAQTNPGQLPQPLRKIASGGELSRIMLALKGILAQSDRISVLVFDEIDANVGGRLGSTIGQKLRQLASHHQVLCITHLPQIASYADRHFTVRKEVVDDETSTTVRIVIGPDRIEELAEMIGGHRVTPTTRAQAQELLDAATSAPHATVGGKNGKPAKKLVKR
ncbi:MAG TPA: DNA repair protein RecN, partial [Tepidisphaeraceae bacterium]|nr:DNA repair protein RecN [Tepidisphaeraceae bacterium]